jgi:hypothetical protein
MMTLPPQIFLCMYHGVFCIPIDLIASRHREGSMSDGENSRVPRAAKMGTGVTRRDVLKGAATLSVAGALAADGADAVAAADPFSDASVRCASELSGGALSEERIRAMRLIFDVNMKHIQVLREFDPGEAEPVTTFRL